MLIEGKHLSAVKEYHFNIKTTSHNIDDQSNTCSHLLSEIRLECYDFEWNMSKSNEATWRWSEHTCQWLSEWQLASARTSTLKGRSKLHSQFMTKIQVGHVGKSWSNLCQLRFDQDFTSWPRFDQHFTIGNLDLDQDLTNGLVKTSPKVHHQILAIMTNLWLRLDSEFLV